MIPSDKCYSIIKHFEQCRLKAYADITGLLTIGWGTVQYENGAPIKEGDIIPQFRADQLLDYEVKSKARSVQTMTTKVKLKQCQYDALISFAYNLGAAALSGSTLLKKVLLNPDDPFINDCFLMWNKAKVNGVLRPVDGLTVRRKSEAFLYFNDSLNFHE